jgi:hypothetical protein
MTEHDTRTVAIPRPRAAQDDAQDDAHDDAPVGEFPWPEPWRSCRGARPRSEYWDAATASWHSRGPVFPPRQD